MIKNNFKILKKTHAYLQTILKAPVKFQKDQTKTVVGVKGTRYLLKIRNHAPRARRHAPSIMRHAPRKAKNSVPPLFFEKAGNKNKSLNTYNVLGYRQIQQEIICMKCQTYFLGKLRKIASTCCLHTCPSLYFDFFFFFFFFFFLCLFKIKQ